MNRLSEDTVVFYFMRHGEYKNNRLTERGVRQIQASARQHLAGIEFELAFCSGEQRTKDTVIEVLRLLQPSADISRVSYRKAFSFDGISDVPVPNDFNSVDAKIKARFGNQATIRHWLKFWPPAEYFQHRLLNEMMRIADRVTDDTDRFRRPKRACHIIVGSHTPLGELAVLDPAVDQPVLQYGDIVKYVVDRVVENYQNYEMPSLVESVYLPCPVD